MLNVNITDGTDGMSMMWMSEKKRFTCDNQIYKDDVALFDDTNSIEQICQILTDELNRQDERIKLLDKEISACYDTIHKQDAEIQSYQKLIKKASEFEDSINLALEFENKRYGLKQLESDIQVALSWFMYLPETEIYGKDYEVFTRLKKQFTDYEE